MDYLIYETSTGKILRLITVTVSDETGPNIATVEANVDVGQAYIQASADEAIEYVLSGVVTSRPALSAVATWSGTTLTANGVASVTLSTLPTGTVVMVRVPQALQDLGIPESTRIEVTDGSFVFSTPFAGVYTIETSNAFPYKDSTQEITAS